MLYTDYRCLRLTVGVWFRLLICFCRSCNKLTLEPSFSVACKAFGTSQSFLSRKLHASPSVLCSGEGFLIQILKLSESSVAVLSESPLSEAVPRAAEASCSCSGLSLSLPVSESLSSLHEVECKGEARFVFTVAGWREGRWHTGSPH